MSEQTPVQRGHVPSIGRVVHYVSLGSADGRYPAVCRAAVVTQVFGGPPNEPPQFVHLCVINPEGFFFPHNVPYSDAKEPGSWHWPERVP